MKKLRNVTNIQNAQAEYQQPNELRKDTKNEKYNAGCKKDSADKQIDNAGYHNDNADRETNRQTNKQINKSTNRTKRFGFFNEGDRSRRKCEFGIEAE